MDAFPELAAALLRWYEQSARPLPWRVMPGSDAQPDPYAVWVSEVMLQQTRVETVQAYYARWMERFPTLQALAQASEQDVLQAWEGLGYYSRARNFWKAARKVQFELGGQMPHTRAELQRLPGVGAYTAAALAALAFGQDEATLDGNIRRVLARLFDVDLPARSPQGEKRLWQLAADLLPKGRAADFNQALMDLGAQVCTPQSPRCLLCPLQRFCLASQRGTQLQRPVLPQRKPVPHLTVTAAVIERAGRVLIARRPPEGLLGSLWEFPGGTVEVGESLPDCLRRELQEELGVIVEVGDPLGVYHHAYTHFRITLHAFACHLLSGEPQALEAEALAWVLPAELPNFPMGKVDRQIARRLLGGQR
ncbi:MAG: A/G-specific adenine glycosylase [Longilinea sp.]|nr:A/G-specific adenine glycosylase [Longilinea sp.]